MSGLTGAPGPARPTSALSSLDREAKTRRASGSSGERESDFALALLSALVGAIPAELNSPEIGFGDALGAERGIPGESLPDNATNHSASAAAPGHPFVKRASPDLIEASAASRRAERDSSPEAEAADMRRDDSARTSAPAAPAANAPPNSTAAPDSTTAGAAGASTTARASLAESGARALANLGDLRAVPALRAAGAGTTGTSTDTGSLADLWLERLAKLQAQNGAAKSTFVIPFEDSAGTSGQVRLALRGRSLTATIVTADQKARERLEASLDELRQALIEKGFADARLRIREPRPTAAPDDLHDQQNRSRRGDADSGAPKDTHDNQEETRA